MLIDCRTCVARDLACDDCVVTVLLSSPPPAAEPEPAGRVELDETARSALATLAGAGLVPPLRLVTPLSAPDRDIA